MKKHKQWAYDTGYNLNGEELYQHGRKSWELISVVSQVCEIRGETEYNLIFYFKREILNKQDDEE